MHLHRTAQLKSITEKQEGKRNSQTVYIQFSNIAEMHLYLQMFSYFQSGIELLLKCMAKKLVYASSTQPKPHFTALTGNIK